MRKCSVFEKQNSHSFSCWRSANSEVWLSFRYALLNTQGCEIIPVKGCRSIVETDFVTGMVRHTSFFAILLSLNLLFLSNDGKWDSHKYILLWWWEFQWFSYCMPNIPLPYSRNPPRILFCNVFSSCFRKILFYISSLARRNIFPFQVRQESI